MRPDRFGLSITVAIAAAVILGLAPIASAASNRATHHAPSVSAPHFLPKRVVLDTDIACPKGKPVDRSRCAESISTNGSAGLVFITNGRPGKPVLFGDAQGALDCPTTTRCVLSGEGGNNGEDPQVWWLNGKTVTSKTTVVGIGSIIGITCRSADSCLAYGNGIHHGTIAIVSSTETTATAKVITGADQIIGAACESATDCVAIGDDHIESAHEHGLYLRVGASSISGPHRISGYDAFDSVSCGTRSTCWIAGEHYDSSGSAVRVTSLRQDSVAKTKSVSTSAPVAISCWNATDCMLDSQQDRTDARPNDAFIHLHGGSVVGTGRDESMHTGQLTCPTHTACLAAGQTDAERTGYLVITP
jgi:hypothetical protein